MLSFCNIFDANGAAFVKFILRNSNNSVISSSSVVSVHYFDITATFICSGSILISLIYSIGVLEVSILKMPWEIESNIWGVPHEKVRAYFWISDSGIPDGLFSWCAYSVLCFILFRTQKCSHNSIKVKFTITYLTSKRAYFGDYINNFY